MGTPYMRGTHQIRNSWFGAHQIRNSSFGEQQTRTTLTWSASNQDISDLRFWSSILHPWVWDHQCIQSHPDPMIQVKKYPAYCELYLGSLSTVTPRSRSSVKTCAQSVFLFHSISESQIYQAMILIAALVCVSMLLKSTSHIWTGKRCFRHSSEIPRCEVLLKWSRWHITSEFVPLPK